jgi:hypothetical protein
MAQTETVVNKKNELNLLWEVAQAAEIFLCFLIE